MEVDIIESFKDRVSGALWINGNHYTFFALDFKKAVIGYGDSACPGCSMPPAILAVFTWWLQQLRSKGLHSENWSGDSWPTVALPVSSQRSDDDFLCGILAVNGLEHTLCPGTTSLLSPDQHSLAQARIKAFLDILGIHKEAVSLRQICL